MTIKLLIDSIFVSGLHAFEELVYEGITLAKATTGVVLGLSLYEFIILLIFYGFVAYTVLFDVFQIYRVYQAVSCCLFTWREGAFLLLLFLLLLYLLLLSLVAVCC